VGIGGAWRFGGSGQGHLTKLLTNEAVKSYIGRHEPEILTHLELVVNTVSMEEAVQQRQEAEV